MCIRDRKCTGHVPDLSFSLATDSQNAFEWEPFVLDSLEATSPLLEHNLAPGDAVVKVNGHQFHSLAHFDDLVLSSFTVELELVRLAETDLRPRFVKLEKDALEAEVARRATLVARAAYSFGGIKGFAASKVQAVVRGVMHRLRSRVEARRKQKNKRGNGDDDGDGGDGDELEPHHRVALMIARNELRRRHESEQRRDKAFMDGVVHYVRGQVAEMMAAEVMVQQTRRWAKLVWARMRGLVRVITVQRDGGVETDLGARGEVPAQMGVSFSRLQSLRASYDNALRVTSVTDGSPLHREGLRPGDLVLTIDGAGFEDIDGFRKLTAKPGSLALEVLPAAAVRRIDEDVHDAALANESVSYTHLTLPTIYSV